MEKPTVKSAVGVKGANSCLAYLDELAFHPVVSTSSLVNETVGVCPKCGKPFGPATVLNGVPVYFCESCCVTEPLPDSN